MYMVAVAVHVAWRIVLVHLSYIFCEHEQNFVPTGILGACYRFELAMIAG